MENGWVLEVQVPKELRTTERQGKVSNLSYTFQTIYCIFINFKTINI